MWYIVLFLLVNPFSPGFNRIPSALIECSAVRHIVDIQLRYAGQSGGYPYALQLLGFHIWEAQRKAKNFPMQNSTLVWR